MKRFLSSLWFLSILFIFISCEIGLGSSVDTEAPQIEITTPKPGSIIRGEFKIGGNWADDGKIESILINLERTDGKTGSQTIKADFSQSKDGEQNPWSSKINPQNKNSTLIDGDYIATIEITDSGKHTTSKTVQFTIDNTAPIIVLQRPSTKNTSTQIDSYGQKFTLEGQAADDNNIDLIEMLIFSDKECKTLIETVPLKNVPNSINLDVAEFKENEENIYSKIYGSSKKEGTKNFYFKIVAYDGASFYPSDREQTEEDKKGNKTEIYYLYEDIATSVLSEVKITDVYHIMSGVYDLENSSSREADNSSLSVKKVKEELEKNVVNSGRFSLNPANNPTFTVTGRNALHCDGKDFDNEDNGVNNGNTIVVEVATGLDAIPLVKESLKVYAIECDTMGKPLNQAKKIYIDDGDPTKSGTSYKFKALISTKKEGFSVGKNYILGVDGSDENGNSVVPNGMAYGFSLKSSGVRPVISITKPSILYYKNGDDVEVEGSFTTEGNTTIRINVDEKTVYSKDFKESEGEKISSSKIKFNFNYKIPADNFVVYDENKNQISKDFNIKIIADYESEITTETKSITYDVSAPKVEITSHDSNKIYNGDDSIYGTSVMFSGTTSDVGSAVNRIKYSFANEDKEPEESAWISKATSNEWYIEQKIKKEDVSTEGLDEGVWYFFVKSVDMAGNESEVQKVCFYIDQNVPVIKVKGLLLSGINFLKENSVSFEVETDKEDNLKVEVSLSSSKGSIPLASESSENYLYKFTAKDLLPLVDYEIEIKVTSFSGRFNIQKFQLYFDNQKPNVDVIYPLELDPVEKDSFEIKGTMNDPHSGVKTVSYKLYKAKDAEPGDWANIDFSGSEWKKTVKLNEPEECKYVLKVKAQDYAENESEIKTVNFYYDIQKPQLQVNNVISPINKDFVLNGKVWDSNEIKNVTIYKNSEIIKEFTAEELKAPTEPQENNWELEVGVSQNSDAEYKYSITATDVAGRTETKDVSVLIDTTAPKVGISKTPSTEDSEGTVYVFEGTANDGSGSGVEKILMKFEGTEGEISVPVSSTWLKSITFSDYEYFNTSGEKKVLVKAKDRAGNESLWTEKSFDYDKGKPEAEITAYKTEEAAGYTTLTSAGVKAGKAFSLKGKATDDWEVTSVRITQKQGERTVVVYENNKGGDWEVERLPRSFDNAEVTNVESGEYEYVLEVTDKAGKKTQVTMKAGIDTNAPEVTVEDPEGITQYSFINTKNLTIKGNVKDANLSVAKACLKKENESSENYEAVSVGSDGSFSWKVYDVEEGTYQIKVYAEDSYGNNTTVTGNYFTVDTTAPVSTLRADSDKVYDRDGTAQTALSNGSSYYVKDDTFELSGEVTEENLKSMTLDGSSVTVTNNQWNAQITPSGETAETHTIVLEDKAGNKTVYTVYVSKDKSAPLLTVTSPTEGVNAASIKVRGQVSDLGIGVKSVTCSVYKTDGTNETQVGKTQTLSGVAGQFEFNEVTLDSEGKYKVKISAQDKLGNKTEETVIETVNDKTGPVIQTPGIGEAKIADYTKEGKTYRVYAKDTFYLTVKVSDALSKVSAVTAESGSVSTSLNQTADGTYTGTVTVSLKEDGTASIKIKATDSCGNTSESVTDDIMVDKVAPDLTVTSTVPQVTNKAFKVTGTVSDEIKIGDTPVIVKESAEKTYTVTVTDGTGENAGKKVWSFTVNPSQSGGDNSAADGNHTFIIEATDKAGNKASKSIEVITDVTKPTVSISKTPDVNATEGTVFVFEGTAEDGNGSGVSEIWMKFGENGTEFKASGTSSWLKSITFSEYSNVFNTSGEKKVFVMAKDRAGNPSDWISQDFIYDTKKPDAKISEYKIGEAGTYTTLTSAGVKTGKAFGLKGIATDDWEVTSVTLTQTFKPKQNESGEQQTEKSLTLALELGTDGSWEVGNLPRSYEQGKENEAALITGDYEYKLVVTDSAKKTTETTINAEVDTTPPVITVGDPTGLNGERFINTKNLTITGKIIESNFKTATAKLVKDETSPVKNETLSPDQDGDFSWKVYDVNDGEYTVEVYAEDIFGNENTVTGSSFTVDTTAPVSTLTAAGNQVYDNTGTAVAELTSGSTYYVKGDYRLSGTVTETNFKSAKLGEETLTESSGTWSKEITPSGETTETHTIVLEDRAGNKTVYTVYVSKDTSAPLLTVTSPTEGENVTLEKDSNTALITVTGQVSDLGIGVDSVSYELYKDGVEKPVTTETLTDKAGQFAFTPVDLTGEGKGEGKYKIKVTAQDKLGNKTTETVINFMYDNTPPTLSDAKITTDYIRNDYNDGAGETYAVYAKDTFDIEVSATDLVSGVNTVTAESGNTKVTLTEEKDEQGNGTGKYKGTITAVLDKDNITTITIKATDFCSQTRTVSIKNIMVDKVAPTISNLDYPTTPQKNKFTISVSASDLIALAEDKPVKIKYKKNESDEILTELPMTEQKNGNYQIELTPGTDTDDDSVHYIPDGNHTFTIEATDKAGNKASQSIEVVTDVTAPTWVTTPAISSKTAYEQTITENGNSETRNYYKSNLININVKATDVTSGVKEIVYKLDNGHDTSTGNANITLDELTEGMHTVSIKAVDEAGNVSNDTILTFYIDTKSPLEPKLMRIDSESGAALEGYKDESKSKLVNGKSDVTFVLSASDASSKEESAPESDPEYMSGIKSVEVLRIASNNVNITGQNVEGEDGQYTITIPANKLATGSVTVRITDNVGNTYEGTVFNLQLDNTPPVLKISSPANGATVNKTITISGATTDNDAVAQTVVTVKKGETEVKKETFTAGNTNELSWSLDLDTYVQNITDNATTANLEITVTATDKAGNTASETRTITVDQDKDRPVISFNNVTLGNEMSSSDSNYIWLKHTTELYGTVEDDDGITSMQISNNGTNWHDVTLNTAQTSWSFDVKNFITSGTDEQKVAAANGAHTIYFKVKDKEGKEFTSATSSSLDSVYLVDGENKYGTIGTGSAKPDSVLYVKVDTLFPEIVLTGARIGTTGDFSTAYSNMTLGGAQRTMQFKLTAKDNNGIESVSGTAEFDGAFVTLSSPEVKAYKTGESGDVETTVGASDAEYYIVSFTVDLADAQSGLDGKDGRISLKFTAKDKAGNSSAQTATINYDYKKPEVTITSPKDSNWVSGIVTAYGTIDSAATMYYALSPSDIIIPAEPDSDSSGGNITGQTAESGTDDPHKVETWSGIDPDQLTDVTGNGITVTPKYSQIKGNGVQWFVYFDNQPSTELATHDVEFKKYLINSGITTDEAIGNKSFKTIVRLYLWVKSIDLAGNVTEEKFPILIDPQGDAPQVTISYPAKDGETLGGAVTLLGTASDTIGIKIGINYVWVQIMSGTNNLAATPSVDDVNLWIGKGYKVYTNINKNPTQVTSDISSNPENYYIQANVSGSSWSLKINGNNEFSPLPGSKKEIVYRVYAQDNDNNLSKYQTQYSIFDADNPVLSDLYLRQYSDNETGTGEITASRPYEDDMWIKGDWWLCGTVKDTQGIASLKVGEEKITVSGELDKKEEFKYKISTTGSNAGNKTISIVAEDKATPSHTTKKDCSINYDNKEPVSNVPVIANNKIQNANGFFTFSAEVKEDAVSGAAQSGFKYLAFYFTRRIKVNDNVYYDIVYDIMRSKTDEKNSAINTSGLTKGKDGLFWKELSITRDPANLAIITLSAADENIHTGGLCKIGGSIYMIKNANGTTIELDGSPEMPAGVTSQEALFAIANVVNNNIESGNGTKSTSADSYGYFESISNDDGDHMVESVLKTGTTWKWEANINSRNIPDGEVTLHYVAFDAAGNYSAKEITGLQIANNAPRLASVKVWTDYNGNGIEDDNEHATKYYSKKTVVIGGRSQTKSQDLTSDLLLSGNDKDEANDGSAFMTIKAETKLIPELVGGNGNLYYTYRTKPNKATDWSGYTQSDESFVATGNDDGIDDEAGNGGYYVVDDENTAYISGTIYDGTNGKNPIEITTAILGNLKNNTGNDDPTWFEYVIYDSTEGCAGWSENEYTKGRLSAKFKVALNVQYNDEVKPQVAVRPFYWNSKTDNSVCWDSTSGSALGHIELEDDLTDSIIGSKVNETALGNDPKVSGKIKIEGYAFDNIKLKELYVQFSGHKDITSKKLAATYTTSGNTTSWVKSSETGIGDTWDFEATDVFNNSEGHLVYWTLTVDTQKVDTAQVARLDQKVTVIAKDERGKDETIEGGLESASSGNEGQSKMLWKDVKTSAGAATMFYTDEACSAKADTSTSDDTPVYLKEKWDYQMDIVPYITGVKTSLSDLDANNPSIYNRTALGHYAVNSTETVDIYGFNLAGGTLYDSASTSVSLGTANTNASENAYGLSGAQYFSVSASTLKSGNIEIKVNEIPTLNNINKSEAKGTYLDSDTKYENHYNRTPNGLNNNLLEDDVIFDVWEFDSDAATPISGQVRQPIMKISPATGMIQFAFANGPLYFSMGGGNYLQDTTSHDFWSQSYDFFTSIGYTVDDLGYTYGVCAGGDINSGSADVFALHSSRFHNPECNRQQHGNMANPSGLGLEQIAQNGDKDGKGGYIFLKERIMSPSLGTTISGTSTNLYLAYIDNINSEIRFKSGTTTAINSNDSLEKKDDKYPLDKTQEFGLFKDKYKNNGNIAPGKYNIGDVDVVQTINSAEYLSLGVVPSTVTKTNDVVVLVWNEGTTLKYAYNESPLQSGTVDVNKVKKANFTWTTESLPLGSGVGKYCKVAVDKKGGIHVAAYDQMKGDLKYAYRSGYKSGKWQTCTVDSYGIIGSEISLDVAMSGSGDDAKPIPYISYYADSAVKPKIAYLKDVSSISDGATRDYFTQKWEVSYLPTSSVVPKDHINVGLWKKGSSGEIVDSMIAGSAGDNSFSNWQNNYGTYKNHSLVTKSQQWQKNNGNSDKAHWGYKFANGTKNPMVAYQVGSGVSSTIETAQMK